MQWAALGSVLVLSLGLVGCSSTATSADGSTTESAEGGATGPTGDGGGTGGDDGGTSDNGSSSGGGTGSETPGGGTSDGGTSSDSTGTTTTAGETTTDGATTGSTSSTGGTSTTETTTSAATTGGATTGTAMTGTATSGTTTAGTATTGSTTSGGVLDCEIDEDCRLVLDCCECAALPQGDPDPDCPDVSCFQPICSALGVAGAECRFGTCRPERLNCNRNEVVCAAPEPMCPDGTLAEVANGCWTMACVPVALCNWVPDCSFCTPDEMCVVYVTQLGPDTHCDPIPPDCGGFPDCACAGALVCIYPFDSCSDPGGTIQCDCPTCG